MLTQAVKSSKGEEDQRKGIWLDLELDKSAKYSAYQIGMFILP